MNMRESKYLKQWLRIATRNVNRQRKRTMLLGGAIAFAVLVITVVNAYTGGLVLAVRQNFTQSFGGHVYVSGTTISPTGREIGKIADTEALSDAIEAAGIDVREVNYRSGTLGTLIYTTNEVVQIVDGVDFAAERQFRETIRLVEGSWAELAEPGSILLPKSVLDQLDAAYGESVLFSVSTVTGQRNVVELTIRGVTVDVAGLGISSAYVSLSEMNEALGLAPGEYQSANIYLADPDSVDAATAQLMSALQSRALAERAESSTDDPAEAPRNLLVGRLFGSGGSSVPEEDRWTGTRFTVSNLNDATDQLETVVGTLNTVAFGIFLVLLLITAVGITNSYRMVMIERTQEIGTMRSIGVKRSGIRWIFLFEAAVVAVVGAVAGALTATVIVGLLGLVTWDPGSMLSAFLIQGRLQADLSVSQMASSIGVILLMAVWAVNSPAKAASELEPAEALRTTY